jgi:hypothetical protein
MARSSAASVRWDVSQYLRHGGDALAVEAEHLVTAEGGSHELGPAVAGELTREEGTLAAELLGLGVHVIHELVDEGDGDLLDLGLGIGDLADKDVSGGVDAAFGVGVEHGDEVGFRAKAQRRKRRKGFGFF